MPRLKRFDIKKLLENPDLRRRLVVNSTIATQAREGIDVSKEEAENSYYVVTEGERAAFFGLTAFRTEAGENDGRHVCFVKQINNAVEQVRTDITLADFGAISASPLAFDKLGLVANLFRYNPPLDPTDAIVRQGKATGDDGKWVRCHWELFEADEWVPFAKGGEFCRFYSDVYLLIDWRQRNRDALKASGNALPSQEHYFKPGLTYPLRTNKGFNVRILKAGCIFGHKGPALFPNSLEDQHLLSGILNSSLCHYLISCLTSYSWEVGVVKRIPIAQGPEEEQKRISLWAEELFSKKSTWDTGNEICTRFDRPWVLQTAINGEALSLSAALDAVLDHEAGVDAELETTYARLNDAVYRLYGVNDKLKAKLEEAIGKRPPEIVWPQMEGKDRDQKRREHVDRLLLFLVKRVVEADADGLISFESVDHEPPLLERLRKELHACFPQQDPNALETEVLNELKKKTKGYRRAESLTEWLQDAFFDTHCALYQQRPLLWHLASHQVRRVPAFGVLVHAHKFNADALAKLRSVHIRDRLTALRREAGQADRDGRQDDRIQALADIEEVEAFDAKLKLLQEGHHTGPEAGERDYRILTPWKSESERPQGWHPDLDDGIKVNIAPLSRTGLLRRTLRFAHAENDD